jgi:hypothetical protein
MLPLPDCQQAMLKSRRLPSRAARWFLAVTFLCALPAGCQRWNWRGEGFGDSSGRFAEKLRPPADEKQFSGLDTRAREVERDLGVR